MATKQEPTTDAPKAPKRVNLNTRGAQVQYHRLDGMHIYRNARLDGNPGWTIIAFKKSNLKKAHVPKAE